MIVNHEEKTYTCDECGCRHGTFLLKPSLWKRLGLEITDYLCQPCVEKRLGRKLRKQDFIARPLTATTFEVRNAEAAARVLALDHHVQIRKRNAVILKNALRDQFPDLEEVRIE